MYRRQRRHLHIMVDKFRNTIWPQPPQLSLHRRAALSSNSNGTQSVHSRENPKRSLYCEMSVVYSKQILPQNKPTDFWNSVQYVYKELGTRALILAR
jgi:hypothetical protein